MVLDAVVACLSTGFSARLSSRFGTRLSARRGAWFVPRLGARFVAGVGPRGDGSDEGCSRVDSVGAVAGLDGVMMEVANVVFA